MSKINCLLLQHIFPGFYATHANKKVAKKYDKQSNFDVDVTPVTQGQEKDYIEQVKTDLKEQRNRKKIIEDKAKSLLFIITVSITAITFSLNYLNTLEIDILQIVALIILGLSVLYFVLGAIRAIQTLYIRPFHIIQTAVEITDHTYKLTANKSETDFLKELIKSKQLNDLIISRLCNFTDASLTSIRNGIILFVSFFIMTISVNYFTKKNKTKDTHLTKKEIQMKINDSIDVKIPYTIELKYNFQNLVIDKKEKK